MHIRNYLLDPLLQWIESRHDSMIWNICMISCQERQIIPIRAKDPTQVGAYIRSNVNQLLIFFEHLANCFSEVDGIAIDLQNARSPITTDLINQILNKYTDADIVKEFYGLQLDGENSFKVCIDQPKKLTCLLN